MNSNPTAIPVAQIGADHRVFALAGVEADQPDDQRGQQRARPTRRPSGRTKSTRALFWR